MFLTGFMFASGWDHRYYSGSPHDQPFSPHSFHQILPVMRLSLWFLECPLNELNFKEHEFKIEWYKKIQLSFFNLGANDVWPYRSVMDFTQYN